jgi:nucleoside-diphosphate-sugar epimerase
MRVLVTGNLGYIGPMLVDRLRAGGHETVGFDTGWFLHEAAAATPLPDVQYVGDLRDLVGGDLASRAKLDDLLTDVDAVCHLAGLSNDPISNLDPALTQEINFAASAGFADAVAHAGIEKFVFYSSCSVYGAADGEVDELSPTNPLTAYAETKLALERHLQSLAGPRFMPLLFRNATVYGYAPALRLDLLVNGMTAWAMTTGVVRLMSTGDAFRPQLHIDDLTGLTVHVLELPRREFARIAGEPLNVGAIDCNYSIRELAEQVAERIEGAEVRLDRDAWVDSRSYRVNFTSLAEMIPGHPLARSVDGSIQKIAEMYSRVGLAEADVRSLRYTRLRQLERARQTGTLSEDLRRLSVGADRVLVGPR